MGEATAQKVDSLGIPLTTNSNNINEDIWNKEGTIYQPKQDSKYKRLIRKPINTLTQEEIKYIFTIHWCWYLANVRRFDYIEDALENTDDRFSEEYFKECYDFLHSLSFPLKVYRAIRDSEHSNDGFTISGKNASYSWSTNINIYKDSTSKFRNCTKIVSCEIDSNVIDVANTINNFIFYTSSHHDRGYGEYEITLKQHFPQSALKNLHWIDKNEINEKLLSESLHRLDSNCFITDSPYDIKNLIMNKPKLYRILYDANIDMYMIGDGYDIVHWDMIQEAKRQGYYVNQEEFIDELGGTLDNYVETGINGLYEDDYEINPYLLYMISSPSAKEWDEEVMEYGDDGYNSQLKFNFGYLFLRDADENLMDNCDLIRILQKQSWANESMNLNESLQDELAVREFARECREDGFMPMLNYDEFEDLLKDRGMTPSQELYQVYVDTYNHYNKEDTDYIEVVRKKFEQMSSNEIIDLLGVPNSNDIDANSPMFILPNGSILSVAQAGKLIGQNLDNNIHSDMVYVILSAIAEKCGYDWDMDDGEYEESKLSYLTYGLDWARVNCGQTWLEDRFYCVLPNHMTSAQYRSLEKWLEWGADTGKKEVLVYVGRDEVNQTYYFNETFPEDIIKKIKRYYSSGRLYESLDKNNLLDIIYNQLPVQKEVYNGNTLILPDGRFIITHKLNKDSLFHEGIYDYICDIFDEDIPYGDIEDTLLTQYGCVKVDNVYPYVAVSHNRPTAAQYRSLTDWIDSIVNTSDYENRYIVDMGLPIEVRFLTTDKYYDLQYEDSNSIVRKIKKAFTSGILESNRNEMKNNMTESNMNIHPQVAKELEYYRRIADSPYNKGCRREYENIDNYKEYQKEIDRNGDKNLLVYGRFSNPNEYRGYTVDKIKKNNKVVYAVPFARRYKDSDLLVHRPDSGGEILVNIEDIVVVKNVNEMKENMEELTKDFSKVANPKSGDKLTIIDDKDREWNYVAHTWSAPGFYSGMAWKGQKGNPWVTNIAANPRAFSSEFFRGVKSIVINDLTENVSEALQMDNGMIEDDYFTFERDNITYHFFFKPTRRTEKGKYAILAVDYGIRFDKEPYKDEKGHTIIPTSRVHDKPQQLAYFEFNEDTHPEIAYAMTEDDRKEYRDLVVTETKKHINGSMNEEFVSELVPGELYHFIHNNEILYGTFKRKTPAWLFFDVEGKEVMAKPWTSVATTTEELEELIGLVNKMERDTKIPSQVPNRFTRVPNQHNKPMGESIDHYTYRLTKIVKNVGSKIISDGWYKDYDDESTLHKEVVEFVKEILHSDNQDNYIPENDYEFIKDETEVAGVRNKNAYGGGKYEFDTEFCDSVANKVIELSNRKNESNELEQRAKKHKKKSKGMGWHMAVNAGDVEKGIEVFNNSTSLGSDTSGGEGTAMGEALDQNTYYYDGPIYYDGRKIAEKSDIYTTAKSLNIAIRNTLFKAAKGDKELYHYDIVDHLVREIPKTETPKVRPLCKVCGYEINDMGDCPVCDYGEDDLLESLSSLEALWQLNSIDE